MCVIKQIITCCPGRREEGNRDGVAFRSINGTGIKDERDAKGERSEEGAESCTLSHSYRHTILYQAFVKLCQAH
jgi:hypothetical protein